MSTARLVAATYNSSTGTLTPTTALSDGSYSFTYSLTDAAGNESAKSPARTFTVDTASPITPSSAPSGYIDDVGNQTSANASNTAATTDDTTPGIYVGGGLTDTPQLYVNGTLVAATYNGSTGTLTPNVALSDGSKSFTYSLTDAAGNESAKSPALTFTVDGVQSGCDHPTTSPSSRPRLSRSPAQPGAAPSGYTDDAGSITSSSASNTAAATDDTTPAIYIGAALTDTPKLYVNGTLVAATYNSSTGTLTPTTALTDGNYSFTYSLTDAAGNESAKSPALSFTVDTTPPAQPTAAPSGYTDDAGSITSSSASNTAATTDDTTPGIYVGGGLTDTPKLYINGTLVAASYNTIAGTLTPPTALPEGSHSFAFSLTDSAGNESAKSAVRSFTVDTTPPSTPAAAPSGYTDDVGSQTSGSSTAASTDDTTPGIFVGVGLTDSPNLYVNGTLVAATYNSSTGTLTPTTALVDGNYSFTYSLTDAAGNESNNSAALSFTVDTTPPARPAAAPSGYTDDAGSITSSSASNTAASTDDDTPGLFVGIGLIDIPRLYMDGMRVDSTYNSSTGTLTPMTALPDGSHSFSYSLTDAAGNESLTSPTRSFTVDTAAPSTPSSAPSGYIDDAGSITSASASNTAASTDDTTPGLFVGTGLTDTPQLYINGTRVPSSYNSSTGTLTPTTPLSDASYTFEYTLTDASGNESGKSAAFTLTVDTAAAASLAAITLDLSTSSDSGTSSSDDLTKLTTPTVTVSSLSGIAMEPGDILQIVDTSNANAVVGSYTVQAVDLNAGAWNGSTQDIVISALAGGAHALKVRLSDAAGNTGTPGTAALTITIDTTPPSSLSAITLDLATASDSGTSTSDDITHLATPTITVSSLNGVVMAAGDILQLVDASNANAVMGSYTVLAGDLTAGVWNGGSKDIVLSTLTNGTHALKVQLTDEAGNQGVASASLDVQIDTIRPTVQINSGSYFASTDTLVVKGLNFDTLLSGTDTAATDIKERLDWSRLSLDIDADSSAPDVIFTLADIASAKVVDSRKLEIRLVSGAAMEALTNFGTAGLDDALDIGAGFVRDLAGNVATTDGVTNAPLAEISVDITSDVGALKIGETAQITFSFSEPPVDFDGFDVTTTGGHLSAPQLTANPATYTATFTPTAASKGNAIITVARGSYTNAAGSPGGAGTTPAIDIDTQAPASLAGALIGLASSSDSGTSNSDLLTRITTPVITVGNLTGATIEVGDALEITDTSNGNAVVGRYIAVLADMVAGSWGPSSQKITLTIPLATGPHALKARLMDPAGNVGDLSTASVSITIDTSPPSSLASQTVTLQASDDSGVSNSDGLTNVTLPTVNVSNLSAVTMAVGDVIEITDTSNASAVVARYTIQASDLDSNTGLPVWSGQNITLNAALSSGQHVLVARLADLAGNPGVSSSGLLLNIDTTNPSSLSAAILDLLSASDTGTSSSDNITGNSSPQMSVGGLNTIAMAAGDRIQVVDTSAANAVVGTYTVLSTDLNASGRFKTASQAITLSASLTDGVHALAVRLLDSAGNAGVISSTLSVTMDTLAPTSLAGVALDLISSSDSGSSSTDNKTHTTLPTISLSPLNGLAMGVGDVIQIVDANNSTRVLGSYTVLSGDLGAGGLFTAASKNIVLSTDLTEGTTTLAARLLDVAGNPGVASASTLSLVVDITAPTSLAGLTLDLPDAQDSGLSNTDNTTSISSPVITVSSLNGKAMVAGDVIQIVDTNHGNAVLGSYTVLAADLLAGQWAGGATSITLSQTISDGSHVLAARLADDVGNPGVPGVAMSVTVDTTAPAVVIDSASFFGATDTLELRGLNFDTLLSGTDTAATDIKSRLDWSRLSWDINGDNGITANVGFSLGDIASANVTDSNRLRVELVPTKATDLKATPGFGLSGGADTLDITAGLSVDAAGNVSTSDGISDSTTTAPQAGDAVIDLGAYGKLIAPVQVDGGNWYYYWDRSGDGTSANTGSLNGGLDTVSHDVLDALFTQDSGGVTGGNGNTTDTFRYATLNDIRLALPKAGGTAAAPYGSNGINNEQLGSAVGNATAALGSNAANATYDDLLAIWDAYNGVALTAGDSGTPTGWQEGMYWSATPTASGHATVHLRDDMVSNIADYVSRGYVALQVIKNDHAPVITSSAAVSYVENGTAAAYTAQATDADVGSVLSYTLGGADAARFTINASTGVVSFVASPDFERPLDVGANNVYDLIVKASDGSRSSVARNVTLTVTDTSVNDTTPTISSASAVSVKENTGAAAYSITVNDPDTGTAGQQTYTIGGVDAAKFNINPSTGVISFVNAPNYEIPDDANGADRIYNITVTATDGLMNASAAPSRDHHTSPTSKTPVRP
jgi:hypothetical protein